MPTTAATQEGFTVAIKDGPQSSTSKSSPISQKDHHRPSLQRLIDDGTLYVPQTLNPTQFATLNALADVLLPTSKHVASHLDAAIAPSAPRTFDYQLGLDELDHLSRTRTTYSFADLTRDIQEAILGLIASRDLTTRKLDLALWIQEFSSFGAIAITT